jgi:SAM-dependent methyltransferase
MNKARSFEENFDYGEGLLPTPEGWIEFFWESFVKRTVKIVRPVIERAGAVLFVGVGRGDIPSRIDSKNTQYIGLDVNFEFLKDAARFCDPVVGDASAIPLQSESVDFVICNMVLHHIIGQGDLARTFQECSRVLKPGGLLYAFEPNVFHPSGLALNLLNRFHLYYRVAGGSNYEYALSPFDVAGQCRRYFDRVRLESLTFAHPRFPIELQRLLFRNDEYFAKLYPLSFCFTLKAKKTRS